MKNAIPVLVLSILFCFSGPYNYGQQKKSDKGNVKNPPDNVLTPKEVRDGWKFLFDGKSPAGWINSKTGTFPSSGWEIKDGVLSVNPATKGENGGGDIVSTDKFGDFDLIVDFMYTPGANSGIKYFVDTESDNGALSSIGCEYQIIDDKLKGISEKQKLASLYDLIAPENVMDNGPGEWNRARIVVKGNTIQQWLNGKLTVECRRSTPEWRKLVAGSKFRDIKGFGESATGRILLQDHGGAVSFRNIKIREFR